MSRSDDEVLVRVEGVSKKFCRSLKKSLWYGVCDIASELNPFGRTAAFANSHKNLTTDGSDGHGYGIAGENQRADSGEFFEGHSQAGLQMDSEKLSAIRSANSASGSPENSSSVLISEISGKKSSSALDSRPSPLDSAQGLRAGEFFAVKDVSFELRRGECLGLIGHNGAGKTTLLKMLNGLIKPDAGSITMRGRVGALIALGAGFNPILTGRENIYINGSVLGLTKKEIDEKIDEIIDFAEIREFIDMPVQSYSSGMAVRLGFAVATAMNPDVLILDEVMAVGDQRFILKCLEKVGKLLSDGVAGILVSHQMQNIERSCNRFIVLDKGGIAIDTRDIKLAINCYGILQNEIKKDANITYNPTSSIEINKIITNPNDGSVTILINSHADAPNALMVSYSLHFKGTELLKTTTMTDKQQFIPITENTIKIQIPDGLLKLGALNLNVSLWDPAIKKNLVWIQNIIVKSNISEYRLNIYS